MTAVAVHRPMEQLLHTLMLANELLPPLETDQGSTKLVEDIASGTELVRDLFGQQGTPPLLRNFTTSNPEVLVEYSALLYPILVDMSVTIVNEVRHVLLLHTSPVCLCVLLLLLLLSHARSTRAHMQYLLGCLPCSRAQSALGRRNF